MFLYILIAVLFFGLLVGIHELGHFSVAKACGIRVEEFSIGMGPAIFKKQKGETLYSVRCVPFGGYCAMAGEDGESDDPRAFVNQRVWKRFLVLIAGSFMNFLLGLLIIFILYSGAAAFQAPVIASFMDGCPYESADAFQAGDRFLKIDGHRIYSTSDISEFLDGSSVHTVTLRRDGKKLTLKNIELTRRPYEGQDGLYYGFQLGYDEASFANHLRYTWNDSMQFVRMVWSSLGMLLHGEATVNDLSGPVGIVDIMAEAGESAASAADAFFNIGYLGALIAVNLAVMNLLPIPALDGGRVFSLLLIAAIEKLTRKKLDPKYESWVHAAGMMVLLALMAFIMFNDVVRIFNGGFGM